MNRTHWFEDVADHLGPAYDRYSFTRGTAQEVAFLVDRLSLSSSTSVLDLGCGTGRHARLLADGGVPVVGLDVSSSFLAVAAGAGSAARFVRGDVRRVPLASASFDACLSLCQGGFGLTGGPAAEGVAPGVEPDEVVLAEVCRVLRPGGRVVVSAFSSYFAVRDLGDHEAFDATAGVLHERTELRDEEGAVVEADLWTTCYTPRELRLLLRATGFEPEGVWSVQPGRYGEAEPSVNSPEYLVVARRSR